jgi:hypothetical protein
MVAVCLGIAVLSPPQRSSAEPILKPRKYSGPIPRRYFTFGVGLFGGAENSLCNSDQYWRVAWVTNNELERRIELGDFGASLSLDASYAVKIHPQFAVRTRAGLGIFKSESSAFVLPRGGTTEPPLLRFERQFDVLLFSMDATGLFFLQDASVKEFQTYAGGGFSLCFPYAKYTENLTDSATTKPFPGGKEKSDWGFQPGVHAVLGFLYHINSTIAFNVEGRVQIAQSKFTLDYLTVDGMRPLNFDVDYTGFIISAGIAKFF